MNKYIILSLIVLCAFTGNDIRKEIITLDWHVTHDPENKLGYTFPEAAYLSPGAQVPVYYRNYQLNGPAADFRIVLENPIFEKITVSDPAAIIDELTEEFVIKKTKFRAGESDILEIQIPALIRDGNTILLLKKFELKRFPVNLKSATAVEYSWEKESVLKNGKWLRISTLEKGIYKIPWSKLTGWGFTNPSQVKVFGAGGMILPEDPGKILYDDLPQIATWHGKNNGTDCLFFYAPGSTEWKPDPTGKYFDRRLNPYTTKGHFFLSENSGSRKNIEMHSETEDAATHFITTFDDYVLTESELYNLLKSGKQWFGDKFINGTTRNYSYQLPDPASQPELTIHINAAARSSNVSELAVLANQEMLGRINFSSVNIDSKESLFASERSARFPYALQSGNLNLSLRYLSGGTNPEAWLDFIIVNYRRKLKPSGNKVLFFRDLNSVGQDNILEFSIESTSADLKVWDVTDIFNVKEVPLHFSGNKAKGKMPASELHEYAAFSPNGDFPEPEWIGEVANQNLHALPTPEFLIITHSGFLSQANELARFHRTHDAMQVEVVTAQNVYNEFSSGNKDATGIRNFIKMFYDRKEGLKYVLLFGDGSYDNKSINPGNQAFIPTFQSDNSLEPVGSFVTDDYFVLLDPGESVYSGAVDLGIGRLPVSTRSQADLMVRKNRDYHASEAFGSWRNTICFIADDGDRNLHMNDSERLVNQIEDKHRHFFIDKIYFDSYRKITGPGGESYPEVTEAINNRVREGTLLLNYVGHANERYLADERVLDISDINSWSNAGKLPVFITATCEYSRFDLDVMSAGEYFLFNPNGGGIGLFSTTRLVFAYSNYLLSRSFYNFVFEKDKNGEHYRMGDIMRLAKINTIGSINKRNFSLLANPALKLSFPEYKVITSTINGHAASMAPDTLRALQRVTISGYISDRFNNTITGFNGQIIPTVFDKAVMVQTRGNAGQTPMQFKIQENIIYRGLTEVVNGEFSFSFVVPKDISYNFGAGRIIYYADNGEVDASGAFENFIVGGTGEQITDNQGPQIELFLNSPEFVSGDRVSRNPLLLARLYDENGINTVGSGIGHDITAVLNNNHSNVIVLNNHYQTDKGDFTSGTVRYQLKNLPVGWHRLKMKAWDVANNSNEVEIEFEVTDEFVISSVVNYPNPVIDHTYFSFEHNQADAVLETIFEVIDQNGRRIDYFTNFVGSDGSISNPVRWDLSEVNASLRSGIYLYRITARNNDGIITTKTGKMVIAR